MMAKRSRTKDEGSGAGESLSFEESLKQLEHHVQQLEEGQLGLTESLECYEQGVKRLKECYQQLRAAERRIQLLAGIDADGKPITQPFDEQAMSLEEKRDSRSRRRTHGETQAGPNSSRADNKRDQDDQTDVDVGGRLF